MISIIKIEINKLENDENKIQKEIEIVGEIQQSLLSKNKEDSFPIAGINIPAKIVSGDFYNFSDLGEGKYGFGVADVSGKGIKSSILMSKASSLYTCLSKTIFSPAELISLLNNEICETISRGMFVTMLIGIYDSNQKKYLDIIIQSVETLITLIDDILDFSKIEKNKFNKVYSVAGGGDTVSLLNSLNSINDFNFVSTAGGAFLEYLEGKELPGIKALN